MPSKARIKQRHTLPKKNSLSDKLSSREEKKWGGRKCQRLLWEWKGEEGGEVFQSRKRKRRIRPPAPLPDSEAPIFPISGSETSFISFQPPAEGRRHISGSQLAEKQERLPNVCATVRYNNVDRHENT